MKKKVAEDNRTAEVITRITNERLLILYSSLSDAEKLKIENKQPVYFKPTHHKFLQKVHE